MGRRLSILLLAFLYSCKSDAKPPAPSGGERTVAGYRILEVFANGADASAPLVVWLHGRGGSPERFVGFWERFPGKAEVAIPQAPTPSGRGYEWFDRGPRANEDDLAESLGAAEEKLWPAIVELAHGRKIVVGGFSQGAFVAFAMAARHPGQIAYAFPISGGLPRKLRPLAKAAPLYALHGNADGIVPIALGRDTVAAFASAGGAAELHEIDGAGHELTDEMREDLFTHVRAAIAK